MKTMTLDEIREIEITEERLNEIKNFKNTDFSDAPKQTEEQLKQFRSIAEFMSERPELYKPKKVDVHLKIDVDILEALKSKGKGYQTRINAILRQAVFGL